MEALILNTEFESVTVLDSFESIIWTERYSKYGDFEIYVPVNSNVLAMLQMDYYIWRKDSDCVMIIESRKINSDVTDGSHFVVTGRSLESILERRIVWGQTLLTGNLQLGIQKLLTENVISPTISDRKINNFIFLPSEDPAITELTIDTQFTGDNLYLAIQALCEVNNIGFRIRLTADNFFVFYLYAGVDRSYDQDANPFVVFSPKFENLLCSNYLESKASLKTVSLVGGEGVGSARKLAITGSGYDLERREMFTDARDISSTTSTGTLSPTAYTAQLVQRGMEDLLLNPEQIAFEGQADTTQMFKYGEHFFMGDIVQLANEYEMKAPVRVTELIRSESASGEEIYPTFSAI